LPAASTAHMHVYGGTPHTKLGDMLAMANVYLAANPTDDTEPVTFDWLTTQAERCMDEGYWDVPPSGEVWWEIGPVSFTCENYQNDPGDPVEVLAADWQVDGEKLPAMLAPRTRGDLRRLLRLAGGADA